jgi:hypothetical protein
MSRAHPHGFPDDTPEPNAQPYSAIDEFLLLVMDWIKFSAGCAGAAGVLAFFFPDLLLSIFR